MNLLNPLYFVQVEMAVDQAEIEREVRRKLQLRESNALAIEVRRKQMEQRRVEEEAWKRKMTEEAEREAKLEQVQQSLDLGILDLAHSLDLEH